MLRDISDECHQISRWISLKRYSKILYQLLVTLHGVSTRQGGEYLRNLAVLSTISENNWAAKSLRNEQS
jgi:hypothetical protein